MMKLVVLASNRCGVLARVTSVISSVSADIIRCHVAEAPDSAMSVLSFVLRSDESQTKAILRKLSRLVDVAEVDADTADEDATDGCGRPGLSALRALPSAPSYTPSVA